MSMPFHKAFVEPTRPLFLSIRVSDDRLAVEQFVGHWRLSGELR